MNSSEATFWDHLDILRSCLLRSSALVLVVFVAAFVMKDELFSIVLAPRTSDFVSYRWLDIEPFSLRLVNVGLTEQFMAHVKTAFFAALLLASPYVVTELFRFVSPALYRRERRVGVAVVCSAYLMFMLGVLLNYFIVFPLTVRFLGTYQVSPDVGNLLSLQSYVDTLLSMSLVMGVVFELPVVCGGMGALGVLNHRRMAVFRRHAVVAILVVAAIITPTTDAFTLFVVALPIWLLYELSILIVRLTGHAQGTPTSP